MNCTEIIICRVWPFRKKKSTPSVSGAESTSSISENIILWDTQARNKLDLFVTQLAEKEGINEQLKARDQLAWVRAMNNIRNRAEEIVLKELIFAE